MMAVALNPKGSQWAISTLLDSRNDELVFSKDFLHRVLEPPGMGQLYKILAARENDTAVVDMVGTLAGPLRDNSYLLRDNSYLLRDNSYLEKWLLNHNANMETGLRMRQFFDDDQNGALEKVKESLNIELDCNSRGHMGRTPLTIAAIRGDVSIVQFPLAQEVEVNTIDYFGWTSSRWATSYGNKGALDIISAQIGVESTIRDGKGRTAQDGREERARKGKEIHPWR
jgi:hypothetical protein